MRIIMKSLFSPLACVLVFMHFPCNCQFVLSVLDELYVSHQAWCSTVHYKSMKCDVSFSQGSVSTLFEWGEHVFHVCAKLFFLLRPTAEQKLQKSNESFSRDMITNVQPHFYESQCMDVVDSSENIQQRAISVLAASKRVYIAILQFTIHRVARRRRPGSCCMARNWNQKASDWWSLRLRSQPVSQPSDRALHIEDRTNAWSASQ